MAVLMYVAWQGMTLRHISYDIIDIIIIRVSHFTEVAFISAVHFIQISL